MLRTADYHIDCRQTVVTSCVVILSPMNLRRLGDEYLTGSLTSLLASTGSPTLGAATSSYVTVSRLPELAMNRADDADLRVRPDILLLSSRIFGHAGRGLSARISHQRICFASKQR